MLAGLKDTLQRMTVLTAVWSAKLTHLASAAGNRIQAMTRRTSMNLSRRRLRRCKQLARGAPNVFLSLILLVNGWSLSDLALRECRMAEAGHKGDQCY
jgi:hypothetical protein